MLNGTDFGVNLGGVYGLPKSNSQICHWLSCNVYGNAVDQDTVEMSSPKMRSFLATSVINCRNAVLFMEEIEFSSVFSLYQHYHTHRPMHYRVFLVKM